MNQNEKTFTCRVCEKPVSAQTGLCEHCGFQHARDFKAKFIAIGFFVLLFFFVLVYGSFISADTEVFEEKSMDMPVAEQQFLDVVTQYRDAYLNARKNVSSGGYVDTIVLRVQRRQAVSALNIAPAVDNWVGRVGLLKATDDGNLLLRVTLSSSIAIETWRDEVEDAEYNTLIKKDSPLFDVAQSLQDGDTVTFSGDFFFSPEDVFKETSLTSDASMQLPTFLFKFKSIIKQ